MTSENEDIEYIAKMLQQDWIYNIVEYELPEQSSFKRQHTLLQNSFDQHTGVKKQPLNVIVDFIHFNDTFEILKGNLYFKCENGNLLNIKDGKLGKFIRALQLVDQLENDTYPFNHFIHPRSHFTSIDHNRGMSSGDLNPFSDKWGASLLQRYMFYKMKHMTETQEKTANM